MSDLLSHLDSGILTLTIDRESARNSLSAQVLTDLHSQIELAKSNPLVRVLVITGQGNRTFCSGGDLSSMASDGFLSSHEAKRNYGQLLLALQNFPKATVAKVNGAALAGGLGLVLACDFAIAADDVIFGLPEIDRGLFPMMVLALLQRHLGRKRAIDWLFLGEKKTCAEALACGLITQAVPRAELDVATEKLTSNLAKKSLATIQLGKRAFYTAEDMPLAQAMEFLVGQLSLSVLTDDAAEGVTAFFEKREPKFTDR
jgi:enoyl-CoA hydratase